MKIARSFMALTLAGAALLTAGCNERRSNYGRMPPSPPPAANGDRVANIATTNGLRDGRMQGRFDLDHRRSPEPRRDRMYRSYPGWVPEMGARGIYRDFYQSAFIRGYQEAYGRC